VDAASADIGEVDSQERRGLGFGVPRRHLYARWYLHARHLCVQQRERERERERVRESARARACERERERASERV